MALNEDKFKKMQDEMSRFEEEIGLPIPEGPIVGAGPRIIGANTYNEAQKTLDANVHGSSGPGEMELPMGVIPPPPPPPPLPFIPAQVRGLPQMDGSRLPMDLPFNGGPIFRGPLPPPPPMPPGSLPPHLGPGPMPPPPPIPPQGPMPPGFGMMGPGHIGGPMGPGPMGGPAPMGGPVQMGGPGPMGGPSPMGGPGPMGPMPPQMMSGPPNFPGPPAPPSFQNPPRFVPSAPQSVEVKPQPAATVLSATPMMYVANPQIDIAAMQADTIPNQVQTDAASFLEEPKKNKKKAASQVTTETIFTPAQVSNTPKKKEKKNKKLIRTAGGQTWEDPTLAEWEDDDFRLFCGDLGNDVTDEVLHRAFSKYPSFLRARVVRDKRTNKTKGFGFVSFKDPQDFIRATKEMNGRYVGSRPIKLRKSSWRNRSLDAVRKKDKEKQALISMLTGR